MKEQINIGNFDRHNLKPILPSAKRFDFSQGDLYFMPSGKYHIGYSKELSLAITFWTYNHSKFRLAKKLHQMITNQFLEENVDLMVPDKNSLDDSSRVKGVLLDFKLEDGLENMTYKELITEMYKDLRYSISSNAGYRTSPFQKSDGDSQISLNDSIIVESPFKIQYRESIDKTKLYVYVRGNKVSINNFKCIATMIDTINKGNMISVSKLLNILDKSWSEEVGMQILNLIYQNHGIIKIND